MLPWKTLSRVESNGHVIELRQRGAKDFLIMDDGRVLMTSSEKTSELALATLACEVIAARKPPRLLIGGLGMGYTLRAALDALPRTARITVAELTPEIAAWCRGPLAPLTRGAALDPRVSIVIGDVSRVIERAKPGSWDAIALDLYEGPHGTQRRENDPFYGRVAIERTHTALTKNGAFTVWSEENNAVFKKRMVQAGFATRVVHPGGPAAYVIYFGQRDTAMDDRGRPFRKPEAELPAPGEHGQMATKPRKRR